jgi:hypothetical protein
MSTVGDDPGGYLNNLPNGYLLHARGRPSVSRIWQISPGHVLRYGRSVTMGWITCVSRFAGLTCRSRLSRHGFFLNRQTQRTFMEFGR